MHSRTQRRNLQALARGLFDREFASIRKATVFAHSGSSWIRIIREALGMTTAQLARRVGVSQPRITAIEKAEADDTITLKTLRRVAEALDCKLVYTLVPNQPLEATVRARALEMANEQLGRTHHTMRLENQATSAAAIKRERDRLVGEILGGDLARLWDAP